VRDAELVPLIARGGGHPDQEGRVAVEGPSHRAQRLFGRADLGCRGFGLGDRPFFRFGAGLADQVVMTRLSGSR
jgi:hypothetical protein